MDLHPDGNAAVTESFKEIRVYSRNSCANLPYSVRSASIGDTLEARRAGT
jgi:hypothetical protein